MLAAVVAQLRERLRVVLACEDSPHDDPARHACDLAAHVLSLEVHLRAGFVPMLDVV